MNESDSKKLGKIAGFILLLAAVAFVSSMLGFGIDLLAYIPANLLQYVMAFAFIIGAWRLGAIKAIKDVF